MLETMWFHKKNQEGEKWDPWDPANATNFHVVCHDHTSIQNLRLPEGFDILLHYITMAKEFMFMARFLKANISTAPPDPEVNNNRDM